MTTINLLTWEDYAIYRAIQGKPIPTRKVWDNARSIGWTGGAYKKHRYFDAEVFSGEFAANNSEFAKAHPKLSLDTTWIIEKSDGSLGSSGALSSIFTQTKKAYLYVDFGKMLQALDAKGLKRITVDISPEILYQRTREAVQKVNRLLITSNADVGHYFAISEYENPSPGWLKINEALRGSVAEAERIEDLDLPITIAELAREQFDLSPDQERLINGDDELSIYLGCENWFSLLFSHCLDPKIYKMILDSEAGEIAQPRALDSTTDSTNQDIRTMESQETLHLIDIANGTGRSKFYVDLGMAAQEMGIPAPFSRKEAEEIVANTRDLGSGIENYTTLFPRIDDDIDVLYDLAIMTSQSYKSVCSTAKAIGWEKGCSISVQNQLAGLLAGAQDLREIHCNYADRMFSERLTEEQKSAFRCNTIADIYRITGSSYERAKEVQVALGFIYPLSLEEANKISIELVGQPIKIAYIQRVSAGDSTFSEAAEVVDFAYRDIYDICGITGKGFGEVAQAAADLGCTIPFTLIMADRLANYLCGVPSIEKLYIARQNAKNRRKNNNLEPEVTRVRSEENQSQIQTSSRETSLTTRPRETGQGNQNLQLAVAQDYRRVPVFSPSKAVIPEGFKSHGSEKDDMLFALENPELCIRSFFNDLPLLNNNSWIESTLFVPAFNEGLYSQLVIEYHRYSITQLRDQKSEVIKQAERKGAGIGALLGLITGGGLMAPFAAMMGANLNKMTANNIDPSRPIEEFLPDPKLLFMRDEGSFMALKEAYQSASIKRRVCLRKVEKEDGRLYWEVFPMILLDRQATPAQVFKWEENYFLRPITAGLSEGDNSSLGYNPFKMRRSLSYHPVHDIAVPSEFITTSIIGPTIEKQPVVFRTGLKEDRSFPHFYFDYPKEAQLF